MTIAVLVGWRHWVAVESLTGKGSSIQRFYWAGQVSSRVSNRFLNLWSIDCFYFTMSFQLCFLFRYLSALISQSFLDIGSVSRILDSIIKLCLRLCRLIENQDGAPNSVDLDQISEVRMGFGNHVHLLFLSQHPVKKIINRNCDWHLMRDRKVNVLHFYMCLLLLADAFDCSTASCMPFCLQKVFVLCVLWAENSQIHRDAICVALIGLFILQCLD